METELQQQYEQRLKELAAENERLKKEITRLRNMIFDKSTSGMSSKLKDALRE